MFVTQSLETPMVDHRAQPLSAEKLHSVILVVDDDESTRSVLCYLMEEEGYRVLEACDGEEAIAIYSQHSIDLVLLDVQMPRMDGFTCCQRLSELSYNPGTPIVMLTSFSDNVYISRAFMAGASDYLTKPFDWRVLTQRVRHWLNSVPINQSDF